MLRHNLHIPPNHPLHLPHFAIIPHTHKRLPASCNPRLAQLRQHRLHRRLQLHDLLQTLFNRGAKRGPRGIAHVLKPIFGLPQRVDENREARADVPECFGQAVRIGIEVVQPCDYTQPDVDDLQNAGGDGEGGKFGHGGEGFGEVRGGCIVSGTGRDSMVWYILWWWRL
jgi:hypothetical protein